VDIATPVTATAFDLAAGGPKAPIATRARSGGHDGYACYLNRCAYFNRILRVAHVERELAGFVVTQVPTPSTPASCGFTNVSSGATSSDVCG
jgi:hypothetical protein